MMIIDEWNQSALAIPQRSIIPLLRPIGFGTPLVESITSYLARIANMLHVYISTLINDGLFPYLLMHYKERASVISDIGRFIPNNIGSLLDGRSSKLNFVCEALELTTGLENMDSLTMAPWRHKTHDYVFTKETKAWCPDCLREWKDSGKPIYEPLLWLVDGVEICGIHDRYLEQSCPNCNHTVEFTNNAVAPGFCSHCRAWLGNSLKKPRRNHVATDNFPQAVWTYESVGRMITKSAHAKRTDENRVAEAFEKYLREYYDDDMSAFAHIVDQSRRRIWAWRLGYEKILLQDAIDICRPQNLDIVSFVLDTDLIPIQGCYPISNQAIPKSDVALNIPRNLHKLRKALKHILEASDELVPSLEETARRLRCSTRTLLSDFPDLCSIIQIRYKKSLSNKRIVEIRSAMKSVRDQTLNIYAQGGWLKEDNVIERMKRNMPREKGLESCEYRARQEEYAALWEEPAVKASWYQTIHELGIKLGKFGFAYDKWDNLIEIPYDDLDTYPANGDTLYARHSAAVERRRDDILAQALSRI